MRARLALVLLLVGGCEGVHGVPAEKTSSPTGDLNSLADTYCALEGDEARSGGWIGKDCDLTLFNALRAPGCPMQKVELTLAEEPGTPGEWNRDDARTCWQEHRTDSRFSKDMLTGFIAWAWYTGAEALPAVERFVAFAEAHHWLICTDADSTAVLASRCQVLPGLASTVYELRWRLGGADSPARHVGSTFDSGATGTDGHVQVLHAFLRGLIYGGLTDGELDFLKTMAQRFPQNALYEAIARKFQTEDQNPPTSAVLGDTVHFPHDRLPRSSGRCTDYIWQRDPAGADWQACDAAAEVSYTGIDLVFFRAVVTDRFPVATPEPSTGLKGPEPRPHRYHRLAP